jgi:thioredoxin reductase (NADPH)
MNTKSFICGERNRFGAQIIEETATEFKFRFGGPHDVKIGSDWYRSDAVILANGAAARWLGLPNEEKFRNNGISACATCDGPLPIFRNKEIYVIVTIISFFVPFTFTI